MFPRYTLPWLFLLTLLGHQQCLVAAVRIRRQRKQAVSMTSTASSKTASKLGVSQIFHRLEELIEEYNNGTQERRPGGSRQKAAPPAQQGLFNGFSLSIPGCGTNCVMGLTSDPHEDIVEQVHNYEAEERVHRAQLASSEARKQAVQSQLEAKRLEEYAASQGVQIKVTNGVVKGTVGTPAITAFQPHAAPPPSEEDKFRMQPAPEWMNTLLETFWPNIQTSVREMFDQMLGTTATDIVNNIKDNQMVERLYLDFFDIGGKIKIKEMGYIKSSGTNAENLGDRKYWQGFKMRIEATQGVIRHPDADGYLNMFGTKGPEQLFAFFRISIKLRKIPKPLTVDVRIQTITGVVKVMLGPCNNGGKIPFKGLSVGFESMPDLGMSIYVHMASWVPGGTGYLDSFIMGKVLNALNKNVVLPSRQFIPIQPDVRTDRFPNGFNDQYFDWKNGNAKPKYIVVATLTSDVTQSWLSAYKVWGCVNVRGEKHDLEMENGVAKSAPYIVIPEDGDMIPIAMSISGYLVAVGMHSYEMARIEARAQDATVSGASKTHEPIDEKTGALQGVKLTTTLRKFPVQQLRPDFNKLPKINIYRVELHSITGVTTAKVPLNVNGTVIGEKEVNNPISAYYKVEVCMRTSSTSVCKDTEKGADTNPFVAGSVDNMHAVDFSTLHPFPSHPIFTVQLVTEIPERPQDILCPKIQRTKLFNAVQLDYRKGASMQRVVFDVPTPDSWDRRAGQLKYESVKLTWRMKWFGS